MSIKDWIFPKNKIFYDLIEGLATTVKEGADAMVDLAENYSDVSSKVRKIKDIEHRGDTIAHQIYEELNVAILTPLPPQEISRLASTLDEVLDYIDGTARKMEHYGLSNTDSPMKELAKIIQLSVKELVEATLHIRSMQDTHYVEKRCIEVNRLENLADEVLAEATKDLFKMTDAVTIIKLKDIYDWLEIATDKCEDVANVLSDIAVRHG